MRNSCRMCNYLHWCSR